MLAISLLVPLAAFASAQDPESGDVRPIELRCEYAANPLGIDNAEPRLGWELQATNPADRGQSQTAYQVIVASDEALLGQHRGDLWDTGKVASNDTLHVVYAGKPLTARQRCHWKVRAWDGHGRVSAWSSPAVWEMGLLQAIDWKAKWIHDGKPQPAVDADFFKPDPAPQFRKEFAVEKAVRQARLYVSGLGYCYARLNGAAVGDRVLDPGWTNYANRVLYSVYDVTPQVVRGRNCVGLAVGNGWYNPLPLKMWGHLNLRQHLPVGRPRAMAQLEIEYADGTRQIVATDATWKVAPGPVVRNSVYLGEVYDARRETPGWDRPGFADAAWAHASLATEPVGALRPQMQPPIRVTGRLRPIARTQPRQGVFLFDMGQNYAGWARLRVRGSAGTTVKMRFGELLNPDGTLNAMTSVAGQIKNGKDNRDNEYPQLAYQGDVYILSGRGDEVYTPRFTWHGFRYVEVTGYPDTPAIDAIEGLRLSADVPKAGSFSCSNERLNRIQKMSQWTFLSNLFSVQSDCPARERFGYGGDIVPTCEALMFNFDMAAFYEKVAHDFADAARPNGAMTETAPFVGLSDGGLGGQSGPIGWQIAFPLLQDRLYAYYGDLQLIRKLYPATRRQLEFIRSVAKNDLIETCIGDHESLDPKPTALTSTAFYYHQAVMVARFAKLLGHEDDARQYQELAGKIRGASIAKFFHADTNRFDSGTQACQAFALRFDLAPSERRPAVVDVLASEVDRRQGHLATGIFGTRYLLETLSRNGRADLAYRIVDGEGFPGWRHMLDRGATTLWEHWEYSDNTFSHNHPMFGSVSTWFFEDLGGIRADDAAVGFHRIIIQPKIVGDLTHAEARYHSVRGLIACQWRIEAGRLRMNATVPVNTTATVYVPTSDLDSVTEGGKPAATAPGVRRLPSQGGAAVFLVGSGQYQFEAKR
jgi:alpha-L-rhamnosidase